MTHDSWRDNACDGRPVAARSFAAPIAIWTTKADRQARHARVAISLCLGDWHAAKDRAASQRSVDMTAGDDRVDTRVAEPVDHVAAFGRIENEQITTLARLETAALILEP